MHEHKPCAYDTADDCTEVADENCGHNAAALNIAETEHERGNNKPHSECRAEVSQAVKLIFLEVLAKTAIFCERKNCRIVGKISCDYAESGSTGQAVYRLHKRGKQVIEHCNNTELREQCGNCTHDDCDRHDVKTCIGQKSECGIHYCAEHVRKPHGDCKQGKKTDEEDEEYYRSDPK